LSSWNYKHSAANLLTGGEVMHTRGLWRLLLPALILVATTVLLSLPTAPANAASQLFSGAGSAAALPALNAFAAAIGGANNGVAPPPATGGFRRIDWDGVSVDPRNQVSFIIVPNQSVGILPDLFQPRGVVFDRVHSVAQDGYVSVNSGVAGQFPAFTPPKTFSPFNNNQVTVNFVFPSVRGSPAVPAATRGFGAIFLDVETANTSSLEYFAGTTSLGKFFVPPGPTGEPEFLGVLFDTPVVTSVRITVGAGTMFGFQDPAQITPGAPDITINRATGIDQAILDDFIYAEPTAAVAPQAVIAGGPPPPTSGQANTPCAASAGQTCVVSGGANGTFLAGPPRQFIISATGPALTAPGSTPTIFIPTGAGVESFPCTPVGPAGPFTTTCAGFPAGTLQQGATVTVRFALFGGGFQDVTGVVSGPGPTSLSVQQAIAQVGASGQTVAGGCGLRVGQTCQAAGAVNGPGTISGSMRWNLTATVPAGVSAGVVPVAVFRTTTSPPNEAFACSPVQVGASTVACNGTTVGNALQGSTVTVVFAPGVTSTGIITGPGASAAAGAVVPPLLPPPPPPPLPPPPLMLPPAPFAGPGSMGMSMDMPSRAQPTPTPLPTTDAYRPVPASTASQPSASTAQPGASAAPSASGPSQSLFSAAPPMQPAVADEAPNMPAADAGPLMPATPTTLSSTAPDRITNQASMMPPMPTDPADSVITAPNDIAGDTTLPDLPIEP
jgi:hypothetical protein